MRILLTGITGQVGHHLSPELRARGWDVVAPTRETLDLANPDSIVRTVRCVQPHLIINPAAYTAVDKAESEPGPAMSINGIAPGILAQEAKRLQIPLIHYSTDYVFDGAKRGTGGELVPYLEGDQTSPINTYGRTKLAGEEAIYSSGCQYVVLRTSWVYSGFGKNFLLSVLRLAQDRPVLKMVDDQWGAPTWAGWIAEGTVQLIERLSFAGVSGFAASSSSTNPASRLTLNLANSGYTTWYQFANAILAAAADKLPNSKMPLVLPIRTAEYPTSAARPINSRLGLERTRSFLTSPIPTWEASLKQCIVKLQL